MLCPKCQTYNPATHRFCAQCGTPLLTPASEPAIPPPLDAGFDPENFGRLAEERKHVTILFADLKSSLELLANRDPEDSKMLLLSVIDRFIQAVAEYGGIVNQVMGDGVM